MVDSLIIGQVVVSIVMVVFILLQNKSEGLGGLFGASGGGESFRTRRGLEKFLHNGTIILATVFIALSLLIVRLI